MLVSKAVDEYMFALVSKSPHTKRAYRYALSLFATYCLDHSVELEAVKAADVRRYTEWLHADRGLSTNSIHNIIIAVKTFLRWCTKEDELFYAVPSEKTINRIELPRQDIKVIETFTTEQFNRLLAACSEQRFNGLEQRNRAILMLLIDTGIRAEELCKLKVDDIYFNDDDCFVRVNGKGRKQREVGFGVKTRKALRSYILRYRKAPSTERYLFISRKGGPLGTMALDEILRSLAETAGITGIRCSPHTLRHTYAVNALRQGVDLFKLSRLLGHSSVQTTERYLQAFQQRDARQGVSVLDGFK